MVEDIRGDLQYNIKRTANKLDDLWLAVDRFGSSPLFHSLEMNIKTLDDVKRICHALKRDRKYDFIDSYREGNTLVKVESQCERLIQIYKRNKDPYMRLEPKFVKKAHEVVRTYLDVLKQQEMESEEVEQ